MFARVLVLAGIGCTLLAQRYTTSTFDLNGHRIEDRVLTRIESPAGERRMITAKSMNGRSVPVESSEDRVLSKSEQGEIVERTVIRYDADGNAGPPEKIRIERTKAANGSETVRSTTWRTDLNGNPQVAERTVVEKSKGQTEAVIERPGADGALVVSGRISTTERGPRAETVEFRTDGNGGLVEARREVTATSRKGVEVTAETTIYDRGSTSAMEPATRLITRTVEHPDGSKVALTDVYSRFGGDASSEPQFQRQIREEERPTGAGSRVIVTSFRTSTNGGFQNFQETVVEPAK